MTWRQLRVLVTHLPPESHTMTALRNAMPPEELEAQSKDGEPEKGRWSMDQQLLASIADGVRDLQYITVVANSDGKGQKPARPEPMRRPGVGGPKKREALTSEHAEFLFNMISGGAATG